MVNIGTAVSGNAKPIASVLIPHASQRHWARWRNMEVPAIGPETNRRRGGPGPYYGADEAVHQHGHRTGRGHRTGTSD